MSIPELSLANFTVQPLPGGNILLAGYRCYWRPGGADRNAIVYDQGGRELAREVLGDGIGRVLADADGYTWVAYTDEGIYGNYGWGHHPGPDPIGASGLVRWSPDLKPAWQFPDNAPWDVDDCTALNVYGTTAWVCYGTECPIVQIRGADGQLAGWSSDAGGAAALAVCGSRAALVSAGTLTAGTLRGREFDSEAEYRVVLPGGQPVPDHADIIGRGQTLHFITDDHWYQLDIRDLPAAL